MPKHMPMEQRFWEKVNKTDGCWIWIGASGPTGYGFFKLYGVQTVAHRVAYEWFVGPIPQGLQIDHLCRNRACVNPAHLEAVTQRENIMRGTGITARIAKMTHCKRGHGMTTKPNGVRACIECERARRRRSMRALRARLKSLRPLAAKEGA